MICFWVLGNRVFYNFINFVSLSFYFINLLRGACPSIVFLSVKALASAETKAVGRRGYPPMPRPWRMGKRTDQFVFRSYNFINILHPDHYLRNLLAYYEIFYQKFYCHKNTL